MSLDSLNNAIYPNESSLGMEVYTLWKDSPEFQRVVMRLADILGERNIGLIGSHIFRRECLHTLAGYYESFPGRFVEVRENELKQLEEEHSALSKDKKEEVAATRATLRIAEAAFMQALSGPCRFSLPPIDGKGEPIPPYAIHHMDSGKGFVPPGEENLEVRDGIEHNDYWFYVYQSLFDQSKVIPRTMSVRFTYGDKPGFRVLYSSAPGVTKGQELWELV